MDTPRDFAQHGLTPIRLLGQNPSAGRATWLATDRQGQRVVVKRFSFASADASWETFREHEREIAVLRELQHPSIPRFIDAFHSNDAFSLVQAYIDARPLSDRLTFAPGEVVAIARRILAVLVYLQARTPPVIHRDIKPDNILLDDAGRVYLVDFGLARSAHDTTSTIAVGTPGFMPPEQMLGHRLGPAADLYALGATLIACLSGARGHAVRELVDSTFRFDLSKLGLRLDEGLADWLERLVDPDLKRRFPDARTALDALDAPAASDTAIRRAPAMSAPDAPSRPNATSSGKRGNGISIGIALVMLAATAGVAFLATKHEAPPPPVVGDPEREPAAPEQIIASPNTPPEPAPFPTHCSGPLTLENMQFKIPAAQGTLRTTTGCQLTLRNVRIEADSTILEARNGTLVQLDGTTLAVRRGPAVRLSDRQSTLNANSSTLTADDGPALETDREAHATLTGGGLRGTRAIEARQRSQVTVEGVQLDGEIVEDGGYVFGLDAAADADKRKHLRTVAYARHACSGVADCFSKTGYRGRIDVDVIARTRDGSIDAVRAVPAGQGTVVDKAAMACLDEAMKSRPIDDYQDSEVGYRVCAMGGEIMGGTQIINQSSSFFFEGTSKERDAQLKRLFR